ncbi:hypothetical protein Tco_0576402 [Tanacetum coccineum]
MASGGSDRDARDALSKLLQMGTVSEYQNEFEMLIKQVMGISEFLLKSFYISELKPALQIELLRARPTTLVEAFSLARMTEARFEDERTTTTIVNPNDLNIAIPDQVLEESILHTSDKIKITSDNDARDQASEVETKVLVDGKQDDAKVVKVVGVAVEQNNDEPNVLESNGVIGRDEHGYRKNGTVPEPYRHHLEDKVVFEGVENVTPVQKEGRPDRPKRSPSPAGAEARVGVGLRL